jgi:hypothetical protein
MTWAVEDRVNHIFSLGVGGGGTISVMIICVFAGIFILRTYIVQQDEVGLQQKVA